MGDSMDNIKGVIFDLDNTIIDRVSTFGNFVNAFVKKHFKHLEDVEHIIHRIIDLDQYGYKDKNVLFTELKEQAKQA